MRRREFVMGSIAAAATAAIGVSQDIVIKSKLDRIGAMSGNFSDLLTQVGDWSQPATPGNLDIMDFPAMLADRYGIHNVEVEDRHFLSLEPAYYEKFHQRLQKAKSRMVNIDLELDNIGYRGTITPCSPDPQIRAHAIELTKQWIDRAALIECPSVMINQGRTWGNDLTPIVDALKLLRDYGQPKNVAIIIEERGPSIPIDTLVKVIQESGIHANPDMGNWKDEQSMERGLRLMYPLALTVSHVKWNPDRFSLATAVGISREMGFKGTYSLETGGPEPYAMQQTVLDKLMEYL
jgi:xylose isomerase-like TIM barrel protein